MNAQNSSSTSVSASEVLTIKYVYLLIKTLKAEGILKKRKFSQQVYDHELNFRDKKGAYWSLDITFDSEDKSASIHLKKNAWGFDEAVFNFFPQEAELQFISERKVRIMNDFIECDWIAPLEELADNDIEERFMSVKR